MANKTESQDKWAEGHEREASTGGREAVGQRVQADRHDPKNADRVSEAVYSCAIARALAHPGVLKHGMNVLQLQIGR